MAENGDVARQYCHVLGSFVGFLGHIEAPRQKKYPQGQKSLSE
jgi:hypothetical protein